MTAIKEKLALKNRITGILLRDARERAGRTKRECAAVLGVPTSTITAYEEGRKPISLPELEVLAYYLKVPVSRFWEPAPDLGEEEQEEPLPVQDVLSLRHRIVGALLRQARLEAGLSQKELAAEVGCSSRRLSDYEYGERPIPLAELEIMARRLGLPLEHFLDEEGPIGEWHRQQRIWQRFLKLPPEIQEFVVRPANIKYLEIAAELERMSVDRLRAIAEGLLDITY